MCHFLITSWLQGGLKAAINADFIQTITVITVSVAIIVKGTVFSGGPRKVFEINRDGGENANPY